MNHNKSIKNVYDVSTTVTTKSAKDLCCSFMKNHQKSTVLSLRNTTIEKWFAMFLGGVERRNKHRMLE